MHVRLPLLLFLTLSGYSRCLHGYCQPIDEAAGSTVLTLSSQENIPFANPALLPFGQRLVRYAGLRNRLSANTLTKPTIPSEVDLDNLAKPLHAQASTHLSFISTPLAASMYASSLADVRAYPAGDPQQGTGLPSLALREDHTAGLHLATALVPLPQLAFGATSKLLMHRSNAIFFDLTKPETIQNNIKDLATTTSFGKALGLNLGALLHSSHEGIDVRLGALLTDVGSTRFSGSVAAVPQRLHYGMGLIVHDATNALHFAVELTEAPAPLIERLRLGVRASFYQHLALAAGIQNGEPSYGLEVDAFLLRLTVVSSTLNLSTVPRLELRRRYTFSLGLGWSF